MSLLKRPPSIGIDLGTSNIVVYKEGDGIVCDIPTFVALKKSDKATIELLAYGIEAKNMVGKTQADVSIVRPIHAGHIADSEALRLLISRLISHFSKGSSKLRNTRILLSLPSSVTPEEKADFIALMLKAGVKNLYLASEPLMAGLGSCLPIYDSHCNVLLDMGGGSSSISVLLDGKVEQHKELRLTGESVDDAIVAHLRQRHGVIISDSVAEAIKTTLVSLDDADEFEEMEIEGKGLKNNAPITVPLGAMEIKNIMLPMIERVEKILKTTLEELPEEIREDTTDNGIVLTGGLAEIKGLAYHISSKIGLPVFSSENPRYDVAFGLGFIIENFDLTQHMVEKV